MSGTQHDLAAAQFGARAAAYVESAVHAAGEDLHRLATLVTSRPGARVLDLGCGGGHVAYAAAAATTGEVVAYDLSREMLEAVAATAAARGLANVTLRQGPAERLPFPDLSFDIVLSRYSAHHWHDLDQALREAARVLRPGGLAAFADVVSPGRPVLDTYLQAVEVLRDPSHVRDYAPEEWWQALRRAGLPPRAAASRRLRLEHAAWIERMRTPPAPAAAIRGLQAAMADEVRRHFEIAPDGSFTVDTLLVEAARA